MPARVTPSVSTTVGKTRNAQRWFLWAGIIAPLLFATVVMIDGQLKSGYSAYGEALSYLEVGTNGWIQRVNFILLGLLLITFLVGYVRRMRPILGQGWIYTAATFLLLSDFGFIMAGLFSPNPFQTPQFTWPGILHQIAFATVFFPLTVSWLILGVKLVFTREWRIYGFYSLIIGTPLTGFATIFLIHLFDPAAVSSIVGNTNPPNDGMTNRIIVFLGPLCWYLISTIVVLLHTKQEVEPSSGMER